MTAYQLLITAEALGANTIEIRETFPLRERMTGVANSTPRGTVQCFVGSSDGSDDCEITPEEFDRRFEITVAIFR